jgi:hypothetical protein
LFESLVKITGQRFCYSETSPQAFDLLWQVIDGVLRREKSTWEPRLWPRWWYLEELPLILINGLEKYMLPMYNEAMRTEFRMSILEGLAEDMKKLNG